MKIEIIAAAAAIGLLPIDAVAEIGVPTSPGGLYASLTYGYQNRDGLGVAASGGNVPSAPIGRSSASASAGCASAGRSAGGSGSAIGDNASAAAGCGFMPLRAVGLGLGTGAGSTAFASANAPKGGGAASSDGGGFIHARDGAFGSVDVGYVAVSPILAITRVEGYAVGDFSRASNAVTGAFGLRSVDNQAAIATAAAGNAAALGGTVSQRIRMGEVGLRLKSDGRVGITDVAFGVEPFYARFEQNTSSSASTNDQTGFATSSISRSSNVEASLYGGQLAVEAAQPLFGALSLVGRGSVGGYAFDAKGAFASAFSAPNLFGSTSSVQVRNGASGIGARLGAQAGLRYAASRQVWVSLLGSVDYYSSMPTADLPRYATDPVAHVGHGSLLDYRVGLRLTLVSR